MITIYKYQFEIENFVFIEMHKNAKILSVQMQNDIPTIWAIVQTDNVKEKRRFFIIGTGQPFNQNVWISGFIGTIQQPPFVWHIFEA
jgi:hypothetical protein